MFDLSDACFRATDRTCHLVPFGPLHRSQVADQPHVRRRLCFWKNARENHYGRRACPEDYRTQKAAIGMDGCCFVTTTLGTFLGSNTNATRPMTADNAHKQSRMQPEAGAVEERALLSGCFDAGDAAGR